jgi:hypothetical protein
MAKAINKKTKNLKAHLFLSVDDGTVNAIYDSSDSNVALAAAFATAMQEDKNLFDIMSAAFLTFLDDKKNSKVFKPVKKK